MAEEEDHQRAKTLLNTARSDPSAVDMEALCPLVQSAAVDPAWMLWTLLREPIAQDAHSRTTELTAQIPTDWASDNTVPATVRQQTMKELARIVRDRPAAMTDAADTESIEYLLGTLLGDDDDRVAMHALRVHKRLWEADELGPPPGDDAGRLSIYMASSEIELQSMLTDAYPGLRADAAEVLAERLESLAEAALDADDPETAHEWIDVVADAVADRGTDDHRERLDEIRDTIDRQT